MKIYLQKDINLAWRTYKAKNYYL